MAAEHTSQQTLNHPPRHLEQELDLQQWPPACTRHCPFNKLSPLNPALTLLDDPCPSINAAPGASAAGFQQPWTHSR